MPQLKKADCFPNNPNNATSMYVSFPVELFDCLERMADKYDSTMSNSLRTLLYVALKNNFTPSFNYIPCEQRSNFRQYTINPKRSQRPKTILLQFRISKRLIAKIRAISEKYSITASQSVRMLASIALQYNYTEKLEFIKALLISNGEPDARMQSPIIFLDVL